MGIVNLSLSSQLNAKDGAVTVLSFVAESMFWMMSTRVTELAQ